MKTTDKPFRLDFGRSARYQIQVRGNLDSSWKDRLGGMEVTVHTDAESGAVTTLTGCLRDQAELNGVLESLYSLHLPIIRVEQIQEN